MAGFVGAIFDMDGTLLESMPEWRRQNLSFAERHGVEVPPEIADNWLWISSYEGAQLYAERYPQLGMDRDAIVAEYERCLDPIYRTRVVPKRGVHAFLRMLRRQGVRMCVATATPADIARRALEHHRIAPFMEFIISNDTVGVGKGDPSYFPRVAELLGAGREETVVFEDAAYAVRSAGAAGMRVFALKDICAKYSWPEIADLAEAFAPDYTAMLPIVLRRLREGGNE